jgi:hypothetical protein
MKSSEPGTEDYTPPSYPAFMRRAGVGA